MRRSVTKTVLQAGATILAVWLVYLFKGNVWFRLYPVVVTGAVFLAFALSLRGTPLVERFAMRMGADLDGGGDIRPLHISEAANYRLLDRQQW